MYTYICIYKPINIYVYIYMYVCIYKYTYLHIHTCMYPSIHIDLKTNSQLAKGETGLKL